MIVTNNLVSINFSGLSGTLPTVWDLTPTYPNGALDTTHITARSKIGSGNWSTWGAVTAFDNTTNVATWTAPSGATQVEFRRRTPRYSVYRDPTLTSSRVSTGNLQANADQGLYTAIEWAAQYGIDAQAILLPAPGQVPNTLGLQQQTQNYWGAADYSTHVWNFSFVGGYISRSHVKAQVLLSGGWTSIDIDPADQSPQFNYSVEEDGDTYLGPYSMTEDGLIESREGAVDPVDPDSSPFRFIGDFQLYMDFSTLTEVPQALIIYRHTPRNVKVSSLPDDARIDGVGMEPSARHALFVAVELGEQLSQYAPPCDCFLSALETLHWEFPDSGTHVSESQVTLNGNPGTLYDIDMFLTASLELTGYQNGTRIGGHGRFIADSDGAAITRWAGINKYQITISDPPQVYYVNAAFDDTENPGAATRVLMDGSDDWKLSIQAMGNATITFYANDQDGASWYYPQFGTVTAKVTGSDG